MPRQAGKLFAPRLQPFDQADAQEKIKALDSAHIDVFLLMLDGHQQLTCEAGARFCQALCAAGYDQQQVDSLLPTDHPISPDRWLVSSCVIDMRPFFEQDALQPSCSDTQVWHALQHLVWESKSDDVKLLSPATAAVLLQGAAQNLLTDMLQEITWHVPAARLLTVFEDEGHWAVLYFEPQDDQTFAVLYLDGI